MAISKMLLKTWVSSFSKATRKRSPTWSSHFFSTSSSPTTAVAADIVADEDLLYPNATASPFTAEIPGLLQPRVVIYDGVCHLCHSGVKWVIKADKDRKIKFCCVQSDAAEPYLNVCGLSREDVLRRFLFVEGPYVYSQASTAALKVAYHLPFPYSAMSSLLIIPKPLRNAVYDYVAKNRYDWFGKDDECLVLKETEMLSRFVDKEELVDKLRSRQN
ncbi:hypothetical protein GIB67_000563 [Kingdonia uniflora]|uniref:Thiol-disulfide oxidoreductase DCC n=1 Tax=Kingdonia uniflora TaxID=39325 RepID=A0A7J7MID4_9MAGN|nr:hypothetical protein GIB67_000563 [Kingdonia uniflora]